MSAVGSALTASALSAAISSALPARPRDNGMPMTALWSQGEQGAWFDPSDFERYMSATGPELVTNGDFSSAAGWSLSATPPATNSISGGVYTFNSPAGEAVFATQEILTIGEWYEAVIDVLAVTGSGVKVQGGSGATTAGQAIVTTPGVHRLVFKCDGTDNRLFLTRQGTSSGTVTSISVKRLTGITTASLFQDAAGTTPVTAMEQPVGLVLDKRLGLVRGVELTPSLDSTTDWTLAPEATITGGQLVVGNTGGVAKGVANGALPAVAGKTYEILFRVVSVSGSGVSVYIGNTATTVRSTPGIYREVAVATNTQPVTVVARGPSGVTSAVLDNISVREIPGNHASQATTTARPLLSARKNLLTKTEQFDDAVWAKIAATVAASATYPGLIAITETATTGNHYVQQSFGVQPANAEITVAFDIAAGVRPWAEVRLNNTNGGFIANFDLVNGILQGQSTYGTGWTVISRSITPVGGGVYRCAVTAKSVDTLQTVASVFAHNGINDNYAGNTAQPAIHASRAQVEYGSTATRYQRINTATDYDWVGFPLYLKFDGVDDFLQTGNVNFTATDKMTMVAGVRKLNDADAGCIAELTAGLNSGRFTVFASGLAHGTTRNNYSLRVNDGAVENYAELFGYAAPHTAVLAMQADLAGTTPLTELPIARVNGSTSGTMRSPSAGGPGPFANAPLYLGRRGGSTLPLNGHLYQLIIIGALVPEGKLVAAERQSASKIGVQL